MNSLNSVWRAGLLFTAGATFTLVHRLLFLQRQSKLGLKHYGIDALLAIEDWWVAPVVGAVAGKFFTETLLFQTKKVKIGFSLF